MAIAIGLLKMLLELHQTRKTGALDVAGSGARVRLFLDGGRVVFADEGGEARTAPRGELQVKQRIVRALGWANARLGFVESPGPLALDERFTIAVEPLAVAALRLADREDIDELLSQARARFATLHYDPAEGEGFTKDESTTRLEALMLPAAESMFARMLDGSRTISELLAETGGDGSVDRGVVIAALLLTDALVLHGAPTASRISVAEPVDEAVASEPEMAPLLAERAFKAGKKLARSHRLAEAVIELRRAASLYPAVEHDLWAAWAEARSDARGEEAHRQRLTEVAELAVAQDAERGFATYVLGHLARRAGDHARAEELFERARTMEPEVAGIDAWSVRLRLDPPSRAAAGTRSDVVALAPLMTTTTPPPPVVEHEEESEEEESEEEESEEEESEEEESEREEEESGHGHGHAESETHEIDEYGGGERPSAAAHEDDEHDQVFASVPAVPLAPAPSPAPAPAPDDDTSNAGLPSSSSSARLVIGGFVLAAVAVVVFVMVQSPKVSPPKTESSSAPSSAAPPAPSHVTAPSPSVIAADASYAATDTSLPSIDTTKGFLVLPRAADNHRVYVDGELAGTPPPPIAVGCGSRAVKIGAQGRSHAVVVPCGGSVVVPYP